MIWITRPQRGGRDTNAVNKTVSGLLKLMYLNLEMPMSDADLKRVTGLGLELQRRVKEQQNALGFLNFEYPFQLLYWWRWH